MFEAFYRSPWQHPVLLWAIPVVFMLVRWRSLRRSSDFMGSYLQIVLLGTMLDAALTTDGVVKALGLAPPVAPAIAIAFVVLGDFRVLYLILRLHGNRSGLWLRALALSLTVPLLQALLTQMAPSFFKDVRRTFLVYELLFIVLMLVLVRRAGRYDSGVRIDIPPRRLAREVALYAVGYYCLWAFSDLMILAGVDAGYLVRVIPNLLYYGFYAPFVASRSTALGMGLWSSRAVAS